MSTLILDRPENPTAIAAGMFLRELLRRWPTVLFMVLMPASYFAVNYLTSDAKTVVPVPVRDAEGAGNLVRTVLDRDFMALYLAVLGISVTSSFAALNTVKGSTPVMRRLRMTGFTAWNLLAARLAVLGLIMVLSAAVFLAIFLPLVRVTSIPLVTASLLLISLIGVAVGTLVGQLVQREFEASMIVIAIAGMQMALGTSKSDAERYLPYWPGAESLKSAVFAPAPVGGSLLALCGLYTVVLLGLSFAVWNRRTHIWRGK